MAYLAIEDFNSGLDIRKSGFTAPPGSLRELSNAHITRGGEIEKRKAFASFASMPAGRTTGLHSARSQLYVFGHESAAVVGTLDSGVLYQQLVHPTAPSTALTRVLATTNFNGKIYALARFADGEVHHYYNGAQITDWNSLSGVVSSNDAVATFLAAQIDTRTDVSAAAVGDTITVTAVTAGTPFTYSAHTLSGGVVNDEDIVVTETVANVAAVAEQLATGSFKITGGTVGGSATLTGITVNGVQILGATVAMPNNIDGFATAVAAQCNSYVSSPEYTVTASADGTITIKALAGTGAGPNGFVVLATTGGDATVGNYVNLTGGAAAVSAVAQAVTFQIDGTYEDDDTFNITVNDAAYSISGANTVFASYVKTFRDKVYGVLGSVMAFSGFRGDPPQPDPTAWTSTYTGAGSVNLVTQDEGATELVSIGVYQKQLAFFARRSVQIWNVDPNPDLNSLAQVITGVGAVAPRAVVSLGEIDLFFLSETGIRSLRARDSSNLASTRDVGTAVDSDVIEYMRRLSADEISRACAVVDPAEGRVLMALGSRMYVFSHFPGSNVAAWSTYEPGFTVDDFALSNGRLYCRSGDQIYLYGGATGAEYDACRVRAVLPYHDAKTPATVKTFGSIDVGCVGTWTVNAGFNPNDPEETEVVATVTQATFGMQGDSGMVGQSTHISLTLENEAPGPALLATVIIHYDLAGAG